MVDENDGKMMDHDGISWHNIMAYDNIMEYHGIFKIFHSFPSFRAVRLMDVAARDLSQIANAMATIGQTEEHVELFPVDPQFQVIKD